MTTEAKGVSENGRGRATEETLWELWWALFKALKDALLNTPADKIKPSMLAVAVKFLKDNGVTLEASHPDPLGAVEDGFDKLMDELNQNPPEGLEDPFGVMTNEATKETQQANVASITDRLPSNEKAWPDDRMN